MTFEHLRAAHQNRPFVPFTLPLADGRQFHVPHNDFVSYHPQGRTVIVYHQDSPSFDIVDLLLVSSLEMHRSA